MEMANAATAIDFRRIDLVDLDFGDWLPYRLAASLALGLLAVLRHGIAGDGAAGSGNRVVLVKILGRLDRLVTLVTVMGVELVVDGHGVGHASELARLCGRNGLRLEQPRRHRRGGFAGSQGLGISSQNGSVWPSDVKLREKLQSSRL